MTFISIFLWTFQLHYMLSGSPTHPLFSWCPKYVLILLSSQGWECFKGNPKLIFFKPYFSEHGFIGKRT